MSKKEISKQKNNYKKKFRKVSSLFIKSKKKNKPVIFISHNVPFNTPIDKITDKNSPRYGYHFGSVVARNAIDKFQPLVCIGGHMHEHFRECKIKNTVAINAGFGSKVNTLLEIEGKKIKSLKFWPKRY